MEAKYKILIILMLLFFIGIAIAVGIFFYMKSATPKACADWTSLSDCSKGTCLESDTKCSWNSTSKTCSCPPPPPLPPKACSTWTTSAECSNATCADSDAKCIWNSTAGTCSCSPWKDLYIAYPGYAIVGRPVTKSFTADSLDDCLQQAYLGVDNDNKPFPSVDWKESSKNCQLSMDTKDTVPDSYKLYGGNTYYQYTKATESFTSPVGDETYIPYVPPKGHTAF